jgi:hypothetical protein
VSQRQRIEEVNDGWVDLRMLLPELSELLKLHNLLGF